MQQDADINPVQVAIIRELALHSKLQFAKLNAAGLPSDQFSYHLRQLLKHGLIEKDEQGYYRLSAVGKSRRVVLDPAGGGFVTQGFIAVRLVLSKQENGQEHFLIQERLTEPYKGTYSTPGNKIPYGEDANAAARRIMKVQTGLDCQAECRGLVHYKDEYQGMIVQDKYFFVFRMSEPQGELKTGRQTDNNLWMTYEQLRSSPRSIHGHLAVIDMARAEGMSFVERTFPVDDY